MSLPNLAEALAHHEAGRPDEAEAIYRRILEHDPCSADALHLLGVLQAERGEQASAESLIRAALAIADEPDYRYNLGQFLAGRGRLDEAAEAFAAVVRLKADHAAALLALGVVLRRLRRPGESIDALRRALAIRPDLAEAHSNLGIVFQEVGRPELAIAAFCDAIRCCPDHAEAHCNLGHVLQTQGRLGEAAASIGMALHFRPDLPEGWCNLGNVLKDQGRLGEALAAYRRALQVVPGLPLALSNLLMGMHYGSEWGNADFLAVAREMGAQQAAAPAAVAPVAAVGEVGAAERPLRIGYVSGDFNSHPVGYFLESVLAAHDRRRVTVLCYANNSRSDALTERLRGLADGWREIVALGDEAVAAQIRADRIDVLVDLSGHTGNNRLGLFARRLAPVQVSWLGYFGSTGLPEMDWVLADRHVIPLGEERFFSEAVWRLPASYLCFTPPAVELPVGPPPMLAEGCVTFGCFNNRAKIGLACVALWSATLAALPQARLLLKARQFGDAGVREALRAQFAAHGIAANRLRMEGESSRTDYLAAYGRIDVALDPTPFGGGTTTAECLWMGVPVLSLRGDRWAGRIGQSFLATLGLSERLVAADPADFVAKAAALIGDATALAQLRAELRPRLLASSVCDAGAFARDLEDAFVGMWQAARGGTA